MAWSFVIHIVGLVLWLGGLLILPRFMRVAASGGAAANADLVAVIRKSWNIYVLQGLVVASLSGLYQLFSGGIAFYMKQGWFHGKLTLVVALLVATVLLGLEVRRLGESGIVQAGRLKAVRIIGIVSLLGIVALTKALR